MWPSLVYQIPISLEVKIMPVYGDLNYIQLFMILHTWIIPVRLYISCIQTHLSHGLTMMCDVYDIHDWRMFSDKWPTDLLLVTQWLKLPSLFGTWPFWTFHNKSHNIKELVILSHSWSPFLPITCLYGQNTFVLLDSCLFTFYSVHATESTSHWL